MGRKKKYNTIGDKKAANNANWKIWYEKNKQKLNAHRMEVYYEKKRNGTLDEKLPEM
jgi:hypothetical protein